MLQRWKVHGQTQAFSIKRAEALLNETSAK